jgi:hypothetical protein
VRCTGFSGGVHAFVCLLRLGGGHQNAGCVPSSSAGLSESRWLAAFLTCACCSQHASSHDLVTTGTWDVTRMRACESGRMRMCMHVHRSIRMLFCRRGGGAFV